jgi:thiamine biosynthesis lipoprotein
LGLLVAVSACQRAPDLHKRVIPMFGTVAEVEIAGGDAAGNEAALDDLEQLYLDLDRDWRSFGPGELGQANAALQAGRRVRLSPRLAALVKRSLDLRNVSDGMFDPRVGRLVTLWGFNDMARVTPAGPPDESQIESLRVQTLGPADVHLAGPELWSDGPLTLDLNGIAEGAALAAAAGLLKSRGIDNSLIDTGGDLIAIGVHGDRPWRVGVRDPRGPGILGTVDLAPGEVIASSGGYEHRFEAGGRSFHHILDPRTGWPARGALGTTVISLDAELADGAATALMVAGPARFAEITGRMGVDTALLVSEDGRVLTTERMRLRLQTARGAGLQGDRRE